MKLFLTNKIKCKYYLWTIPNNPDKQANTPEHNIFNDVLKHSEQVQQHAHSDSSLGSVFGLLDIPQAGNTEYEEEVFARNQEYESKRRRMKNRKMGRRI
jgi:hypothetical protein